MTSVPPLRAQVERQLGSRPGQNNSLYRFTQYSFFIRCGSQNGTDTRVYDCLPKDSFCCSMALLDSYRVFLWPLEIEF